MSKALQQSTSDLRLAIKLSLREHALSAWTRYIIETWIKQCISTHQCDKPLSKSLTDNYGFSSSISGSTSSPLNAMPSRLLQLAIDGTESWDCKLVDFQDGMVYAALTYSWGPSSDTLYKTTSETLTSRRTRIVFEELPNTLQHAVAIAVSLGLEYLWVDAICIIQDCDADWDHESAIAGGIYSNAHITISADMGNSASYGCINLRNLEEDEVVAGATRIPTVLEDGTAGSLYFYNPSHVMSGQVSSPEALRTSPLSQRGWCFQERILSKRILHYTEKCVYWECRDCYRCEDNVSLLDKDSNNRTLPSTVHIFDGGLPGDFRELEVGVASWDDDTSVQANTAAGDGVDLNLDETEPRAANQPPRRRQDRADIVNVALGPRQIGNLYQSSGASRSTFAGERRHFISWWNKNIVAQYSKRLLTRDSDRLPALSALARLFAEHIKVPYVAGLWLDEIEDGLDWRRAGATFQAAKLTYPTFSWVAQPGPVHWPYYGHVRPYGKSFSVVQHDIRLATADVFGRIECATLSLHGSLGIVGCQFAQDPDPQAEHVDGILLNREGIAIGDVEMDLTEYPTELTCFLLYKNSIGFLRMLMLRRVGAQTVQYQRAGVGQIHPRFAQQWLDESKRCTVSLV